MPAKMKDGREAKIVIVSGVVRATNSFNAVVPSDWTVMMLNNDDGYEVMVITLDKQVLVQTERGKQFLNQAISQKEQSREQQAEIDEQTRRKEEQAAAARAALEAAYNAGRAKGNAVASRFGRNVTTASDALIQKQLQRAEKDSALASKNEIEQFRNGFMAAIRDARQGNK
jgi:hypothetical protein